jgi:hypothetical protein
MVTLPYSKFVSQLRIHYPPFVDPPDTAQQVGHSPPQGASTILNVFLTFFHTILQSRRTLMKFKNMFDGWELPYFLEHCFLHQWT